MIPDYLGQFGQSQPCSTDRWAQESSCRCCRCHKSLACNRVSPCVVGHEGGGFAVEAESGMNVGAVSKIFRGTLVRFSSPAPVPPRMARRFPEGDTRAMARPRVESPTLPFAFKPLIVTQMLVIVPVAVLGTV